MKPKHFIFINAVAYLVLGLWCALSPYKTAEMIGLGLVGAKGLAEYIAVYGGLEFGLGLFYAYSYFNPRTYRTGTIFSVCLYGGIVAYRGLGMLAYRSPTQDVGWLLYSIEISCFVLAVIMLRRAPAADL